MGPDHAAGFRLLFDQEVGFPKVIGARKPGEAGPEDEGVTHGGMVRKNLWSFEEGFGGFGYTKTPEGFF